MVLTENLNLISRRLHLRFGFIDGMRQPTVHVRKCARVNWSMKCVSCKIGDLD